MQEVFIFDEDEVLTDSYMIKAIGKEKIEGRMDEKRLHTFIKNRTKALRKVKDNIDYELLKIKQLKPILEDK